MRIGKILGSTDIHIFEDKPAINNKYILATGRRGPVCDYKGMSGFIFQATEYAGQQTDVTCTHCLAIIEAEQLKFHIKKGRMG
jgi:hypothetical protein